MAETYTYEELFGEPPPERAAPEQTEVEQPEEKEFYTADEVAAMFGNEGKASDGTKRYSTLGAFADAVSEGLTFGLDTHVRANLPKSIDGRTRKQIKDQRKRNVKDHWLASQGGYLLGTLGSAFVPGSWAAKGGTTAAGAAARMLPGFNAIRSMGPGVSAGRLLSEGAKGGAKAGAYTAAGSFDPTLQKSFEAGARQLATDMGGGALLGAATGGPLNYAGARASEALLTPLSRLMQTNNRALDIGVGSNAGRYYAARSAADDGLKDVYSLMDSIAPGSMSLGDDVAAKAKFGMLQRYAQLTAETGSPPAAPELAQSLLQRPEPGLGRLDPATLAQASRDFVSSMKRSNEIPSTIAELIAMATNTPAKNSFLRFQKGMNAPGEAANDVASFVRDRQEDIPGIMRTALARYGDNAEDAVRGIQSGIDASNDMYRPALDAFAASGMAGREALENAITRARGRVLPELVQSGDDASMAAMRQLERFSPYRQSRDGGLFRLGPDGRTADMIDPATRRVLTSDSGEPLRMDPEMIMRGERGNPMPLSQLDAFINQRKVLNSAITQAYRSGDGALAQRLRMVKQALDDEIEAAGRLAPGAGIEDWIAANKMHAGSKALKNAFESGMKMPLKAGTGTSLVAQQDALRRFAAMPENSGARQAFIEGFLANIEAKLTSQRGTHDAAKIFDSKQTRQLIEDLLGPERAAEIGNLVKRAGLATRSFGADKNSITSAMQELGDEMGVIQKVLSSPTWGGRLKSLVDAGAQGLRGEAYNATLRRLGANTDDPVMLARTLADLRYDLGRMNGTYEGLPGFIDRRIDKAIPAFSSAPARAAINEDMRKRAEEEGY